MRKPIRINGLRARLTAWVAATIVVSVGVIFFVVYHETGSRLGVEIDHDIRGDATQLARALAARPSASAAGELAIARAYARVQPYSQASALLFAIVPGTGTASNHPELFGKTRPDDGETPAEQAKENAIGRRLLRPDLGYSTQTLPDTGRVRLYELRLRTPTASVYVGAGESLSIVSRSQAEVTRSFVLAGAITLVLALIASYLVGARVSAPLRRLAALAARVDAGDLAPRIEVDAATTGEVRVLAEAFNHMLDRLADAFSAQREFVADASHELRTPLTVMRGQLELLAAEANPSGVEVRRVEQLVQAEISRVTRIVEDLLLLAQAERSDFLRVERIELRKFVSELWDGLSLTARRDFQLGEIPAATLTADPDRLAQALRNLARNAIEHTAEPDGIVRLELDLPRPGEVRFTVIDDGPGIAPEERDRVFERFHRTDPGRSRSAGGAGLGLAIVRAIADAHRGTVAARENPGGGARIELVLPGVVSGPSPNSDARPEALSAGRWLP